MNPTKWLEQEVKARIDMLRAAARDAEQWTNELEQGKQSEMLLRNGISKREAVAFTRGADPSLRGNEGEPARNYWPD